MKIINKCDGRVSTKGIILTLNHSLLISFRKSVKKGDWWDSRFISFSRNHKTTSGGFSISIMRLALFIGWTK